MFLGSISQGALAYLLRIRDHFSDNGISTERSRSGKANGRHKYAWTFFFKKKYSTVILTKNLSEIKSGVRTIGERIQKTQLVMGLWVETGCLSLLFSILSSCFPLAPSSFCSSSYSFSSSFPSPSLSSLPSLPSSSPLIPSPSHLLPLPPLPPLSSPSTTSFFSSFLPLSGLQELEYKTLLHSAGCLSSPMACLLSLDAG